MDLLEIVLIVTMGLTVVLTVIYSGPLIALALGQPSGAERRDRLLVCLRQLEFAAGPPVCAGDGPGTAFCADQLSIPGYGSGQALRPTRLRALRLAGFALQDRGQPQSAPSLGGEDRTLTIFFQDVRSFTSLSEKLSPTELIDFLNLLLGQLSEIINEEAGTIDKYIGDSIMAFWNAPVDVPVIRFGMPRSLRMRQRLKGLMGRDASFWPQAEGLYCS